MQLLIALTTLLLAGAQPAAVRPAVGPEVVTDRLVIESYGAEPPGSGVFAFYRDMHARRMNGEALELSLLWLGSGQKIPAPGSICDVRYRVEPQLDKDRRPIIRNVVDDMTCPPVG